MKKKNSILLNLYSVLYFGNFKKRLLTLAPVEHRQQPEEHSSWHRSKEASPVVTHGEVHRCNLDTEQYSWGGNQQYCYYVYLLI